MNGTSKICGIQPLKAVKSFFGGGFKCQEKSKIKMLRKFKVAK